MKTVLITGASGYLGSNLVEYFSSRYDLIKVARKKNEKGILAVDLANEASVADLSRQHNPDFILHAAGIKAQACEKNPELARVNVSASELLTMHFPSTKIYFFSTDFIFDGKRGDYTEIDPSNPLTIYGRSKLAAESFYDLERHCIIRTAGLFNLNQPGFLNYVFSQLSQEKPIEAFTDVYSTPTYLPYLCKTLDDMIELGVAGLFHIAGSERVSRFEFAKLVAREFSYDENLIHGIEAPESFLNPRDSSLDSSKIKDLLNLKWKSISSALEEMHNKKSSL
nr:SDR family oxidoreductase [Candidatus Woesearchaeota archaeon]